MPENSPNSDKTSKKMRKCKSTKIINNRKKFKTMHFYEMLSPHDYFLHILEKRGTNQGEDRRLLHS